MSKWRPIKTAPKDETTILVCRFGKEAFPSYNIVFYSLDKPFFSEKMPDHVWHFTEGGGSYHRNWPTHWMPLPEPPE